MVPYSIPKSDVGAYHADFGRVFRRFPAVARVARRTRIYAETQRALSDATCVSHAPRVDSTERCVCSQRCIGAIK
ncbi:unnamed protein product, partial [Iphiclides podalirius]